MKKEILTKYGKDFLDVRSLYGSRVYVLRTNYTFPKGRKTPKGKELKRNVKVGRGAIFLPHWEDFEKPEAERTHYIYEKGLYEAIRGLIHALSKYGTRGKDGKFIGHGTKPKSGEFKQMEEIVYRLVEDICILMAGKESGKFFRAQADLAELAKKLKNVINEKKVEAKEKMAKGATLKITRGEKEMKNVPATIWRLSAAETRILKRIDQILTIAPRLVFFEQTLISELTNTWSVLERLRKLMDSEFKRMKRRNKFSPFECIIFRQKCDIVLSRLRTVDAKPFYYTVQLIQKDVKTAQKLIGKNHNEAKGAIRKSLSAIKFKETQRFFERKILLSFALRQELNALTPAGVASTANEIEKFMQRVERGLDEDGFVSRPKERVLGNLGTALDELRKLKPDFKLAKEAMKRASNLL